MAQSIGESHTVRGLAALAAGRDLEAWAFERRALRPTDVLVRTLYCGICHTDLHSIFDGWAQEFPLVPRPRVGG